MSASRFALAGLVLGVVLLGLLPTPLMPPGERESASTRATLLSTEGELPQHQRDQDAVATEGRTATKQRLLRSPSDEPEARSDMPENQKADLGAESRVVTEVTTAVCGRGDAESPARIAAGEENDETTGQLRQAELGLLRVLASESS